MAEFSRISAVTKKWQLKQQSQLSKCWMICIDDLRHRNGEIGSCPPARTSCPPPGREVPFIETADTGGYILLGQELTSDHKKGAKLCEATVAIQRYPDQSFTSIGSYNYRHCCWLMVSCGAAIYNWAWRTAAEILQYAEDCHLLLLSPPVVKLGLAGLTSQCTGCLKVLRTKKLI